MNGRAGSVCFRFDRAQDWLCQKMDRERIRVRRDTGETWESPAAREAAKKAHPDFFPGIIIGK